MRWRTTTFCQFAGPLLMVCLFPVSARSQEEDFTALSLEQLTQVQVQTASMHSQSVASAPSLVTIVTAEDISKYGYRTLGEALNHVPGMYVTYDHTYYSAGVAGFAVPGDWATRILLLIDGHTMNDNIFGSANYFGDDFVLDMSLVSRIEVVRGPSSALYGSYGIFATVNVITKNPAKESGASVQTETDTFGEKKLTVTDALRLPGSASLLLSGTVFNTDGQQNIYIPDWDTPANNGGHAINMDGSRGYRWFLDYKRGNWEILSLFGSRQKIQPVSFADTVFNDRGTRATDARGFTEALYTRQADSGSTLRWRIYYDRYQYHGDYRYPLPDQGIDVNHEFDAGDWIGSELSYRFALVHGFMTAGAEVKADLRVLQSTADIQPVYQQDLYINKLDRSAAGFAQQEWELGRHWNFNFGVRYDWSFYRSSALSPRAAVVYQPNTRTSLKFLFGRGFRNPNANEMFFNDGKQNEGNTSLVPELADTFQVVAERKFRRSWRLAASVYHVDDRRVIVPVYTDSGLIQFQNASQFTGYGAGLELSGTVFSRLEISSSFQKQKAFLDRQTPANSPGNVGKIQLSTRTRGKTTVSGGFLYMSARTTLAGAILDPVYLAEATISRKLPGGFDILAGVRNMLNYRYSDPIGLASDVDTLPQPGRTFFFTMSSHFNVRH